MQLSVIEVLDIGPLPSQCGFVSPGLMEWCPCVSGPEWELLLSSNTLGTEALSADTS